MRQRRQRHGIADDPMQFGIHSYDDTSDVAWVVP